MGRWIPGRRVAGCAASVLLLVYPYDLLGRYRQLAGTSVDDPACVADLGGRPPLPGLRVALQRRGRGPHDPPQVELWLITRVSFEALGDVDLRGCLCGVRADPEGLGSALGCDQEDAVGRQVGAGEGGVRDEGSHDCLA